jgi:hypothetical protein
MDLGTTVASIAITAPYVQITACRPKLDTYERLRVIGKGQFGKVRPCMSKPDGGTRRHCAPAHHCRTAMRATRTILSYHVCVF